MWLREREPNNIVINDPKGELLVKFYVPATVRNFEVVQFNLINPMKTNIYNPLALASEAARQGDNVKCSAYVENIAQVFFPVDGGDDPVWANSANNAFKRTAFGLIDYYLEEEKELRQLAEKTGMNEKLLNLKVDKLWSNVTLYNCYQLFTNLTSRKAPNPKTRFMAEMKAKKYEDMQQNNPDEFYKMKDEIEKKSELWDGKPEVDLLTLYFNATRKLPVNNIRTLLMNSDAALRAIGGAEKMQASIFGIAITALVRVVLQTKSCKSLFEIINFQKCGMMG